MRVWIETSDELPFRCMQAGIYAQDLRSRSLDIEPDTPNSKYVLPFRKQLYLW